MFRTLKIILLCGLFLALIGGVAQAKEIEDWDVDKQGRDIEDVGTLEAVTVNTVNLFVTTTHVTNATVVNLTADTAYITTGTIADLNGTNIDYTNATFDTAVITTATVKGGAINNTPIGASTPSTGVFTTLDAATLDTASLVASSDTKVTSFNADLLDGYDWDDGQDVVFGSTQAKQISTLAKTADYSVTTDDLGKSIRVTSGGTITMTFPSVGAAEDGALLRYVKCGVGKLILDAADSDKVADSGAGGTIYNDVATQIFVPISFEYVHSIVTWVITGAMGTWVTTN